MPVRSRLLSCTCLIILTLLLFTAPAHAGAWTLPEDQHQLISTFSYYQTDSYYGPDGDSRSISSYRKFQLNPYYEYGFRDDLTLGANLFLDHISQGNASNSGIAEAELFLRRRIAMGDAWVLSVQPVVKVPRLAETGDNPILGSNQWDMEGRVLFGGNFTLLGRLHYIDMSLGYRYREGEPSDQIRSSVALGLSLTPELTLLTELSHISSLTTLMDSNGVIANPEDYDLSKLQSSLVYKLDDQRAIQAGAFTHLRPRNTGGGYGAMTALWWNW